jgi:hypothetical protein
MPNENECQKLVVASARTWPAMPAHLTSSSSRTVMPERRLRCTVVLQPRRPNPAARGGSAGRHLRPARHGLQQRRHLSRPATPRFAAQKACWNALQTMSDDEGLSVRQAGDRCRDGTHRAGGIPTTAARRPTRDKRLDSHWDSTDQPRLIQVASPANPRILGLGARWGASPDIRSQFLCKEPWSSRWPLGWLAFGVNRL